jgi:poly [ADP-ribose] polymerase
MANIIEEKKLICVSAESNANKWWSYKLFDNDDVECSWGRVGKGTETEMFHGRGRSYINTKLKEKGKKGYKEVKTIDNSNSTNISVGGNELKKIAKEQIAGNCPEVSQLVEYLVEKNRHTISDATGGKIVVNANTGVVSTPLGIISKDALAEAKIKLNNISSFVKIKNFTDKKYISNLNDYLMLVPQQVGHMKGWYETFFIENDISKQYDLLDALEVAVDSVTNNSSTIISDRKVFDVKVEIVKDENIFKYVNNKYVSTKKDMHSSSKFKLKKCYSIQIKTMKEEWEKVGAKMSNIMELWHGTSDAHVLSILRKGAIIVPSNDPSVCGRMFFNGFYMAISSSKSLAYSTGFWRGGSSQRCFMFMLDAALGNYQIPNGPTNKYPDKGYDSYWAKPGKSQILNDEIIIQNTNQCNIKYLLELEE